MVRIITKDGKVIEDKFGSVQRAEYCFMMESPDLELSGQDVVKYMMVCQDYKVALMYLMETSNDSEKNPYYQNLLDKTKFRMKSLGFKTLFLENLELLETQEFENKVKDLIISKDKENIFDIEFCEGEIF